MDTYRWLSKKHRNPCSPLAETTEPANLIRKGATEIATLLRKPPTSEAVAELLYQQPPQ